jgi:hypothetical protein
MKLDDQGFTLLDEHQADVDEVARAGHGARNVMGFAKVRWARLATEC